MEMYDIFNRSIVTIPSIYIMDFTTILAIWPLVFRSNHRTASIARFNTMTEDEKKTIDEKKLYFVIAICMSICALTTLYTAVLSPTITITTTIIASSIITIDLAVTIYIANTKYKK